jgi:hypothetical protein
MKIKMRKAELNKQIQTKYFTQCKAEQTKWFH